MSSPTDAVPGVAADEGGLVPFAELAGNERRDFVLRLFDLAREGDVDAIVRQLDAGVPIDVRNPRGDTLVIIATYYEEVELFEELLRRGPDLNVVNSAGQTAVSCAAFLGNESLLIALLDAGADPDLGVETGVQIVEQYGFPQLRAVIESHAASH